MRGRITTPKLRHLLLPGLLFASITASPAAATASVDTTKKAADETHDDDAERGHDEEHGGGHGHSSRLTDERIPLQLEGFPQRPKPIIELGEPFLGTGTLAKGIKLPTGAVWQPSLVAFGALRTAVQSFDSGPDQITEAVARLDLFGNLQLSGSERLVFGFRNFDENGRFTSYILDTDRPGQEDGFQNELNTRLSSLFFEGDFGEIFPHLSRDDFSPTDWGFSIGRQPLLFQEGLLINDVVDGIGITRNTLLPDGTSNFRMTFFYGWNELDRADRGLGRRNREDDSAKLYGFFTSTDFRRSTVDVDAVYLTSDLGDLAVVGVTAVQRLGFVNSSIHLASSYATNEETPLSTNGTVLFNELSWTPHRTHDLFYVNTFVAVDDFSPASRDPAAAGPLGRTGINFAAVGLGSYGAPLSNQARDVAGGAVGYQWFWNDTRTQLVAEVGARIGMTREIPNQAASTVRYQQALGRHWVVVVDGFVGYRESLAFGAGDRTMFGGRLELVTKF